MSYDFEIWTQREINLNDITLENDWVILEDKIQYETKNWIININSNMICEDEDIPDEIMPLIPSLKYYHTLNIEPIGATKPALSKARKVAKLIGEKALGIVYDQQTEKISLPSGYKRYRPIKTQKEERITRLQLIWYMNQLPFQSVNCLGEFIKYIERVLPEALPKRYGEFEPPQFKLSVNGVSHFKDFLYDTLKDAENYKSIVWYPSKPVLSACLSGGRKNNRIGLSVPYFKLEFDARILHEQEWGLHIKKIFRAISKKLQPFFGEARFLKNAIASKTTFWCDSKTEHSPTSAGFWRGIPQTLGPAIVLGPEYKKAWQSFYNFGEEEYNICFVECDDWSEDSSIAELIGPPPQEITQRHVGKKRKLKSGYEVEYFITECPDYWPFDIQPSIEKAPLLDFIDEE